MAEAGPGHESGAAGAVRSGSYTRRVEERDRRRRLAWSTAIFSLATGISRVLGLVREVVVANYFGARGPINAFTIAFQIPNLVRALVADAALSGAFVPVFSELLEKGERARAWRVASTIFWLLLLGLSAVTAVFILLAPLLVPLMTDAYDDPAVTLAQIVIATVVQLLLPFPWLYGLDGRLRLALDVRDPAVRRVFVHMAPVTLGLGLINVSAVIGTIFAAKLVDPTIAPNAIDKAFRVYMLPQGMFSVAIATVLFPTLSRLAARADIDGFRATVSLGLRQIVFLLVPAGVASAVLAEPIVRLLYERGEFGPDQTPVVAGALAAFSLGLVFNGMMLMLNRGFFSLQAPWTPTWAALASLVLNVALYAAFYRVGTWGIPFAISLSNVAGAALLVALLRRRIGGLSLRPTIRTLVLVAIASLVLAVVSYGVWRALDEALGRSTLAQIASLGAALASGGAAYLISCRLLGVHELAALLSLRTRLRRA